MLQHSIKLFFLLLVITGCSVKQVTPQENYKDIQRLSQMLLSLNDTVNKDEVDDLAKSTVYYAQELAREYKIVSPPLWQNVLVNLGLKERGLCHEWSSDLWVYLMRKNYKSFEFHHIGADIGSYFEHNALAVSAKGLGVKKSIVLDAWRDSGKLYFIEIDRDKKYEWKKRFDLD